MNVIFGFFLSQASSVKTHLRTAELCIQDNNIDIQGRPNVNPTIPTNMPITELEKEGYYSIPLEPKEGSIHRL